MSSPKIRVQHKRHKDGIRLEAYAGDDSTAIYTQYIAPIRACALGKLKMTIRNALKLRYVL